MSTHALFNIEYSIFQYIFQYSIYSIFIGKKYPQCKILHVYYSQRGTKEPKITFACQINEGIRNLTTLVPRALYYKLGWTFDNRLATQSESRP